MESSEHIGSFPVVKWLFTAGAVVLAILIAVVLGERYGLLQPVGKSSSAVPAIPPSADCEIVQVKNSRFEGLAMEYPLWVVTTRDGVARARNCIGSGLHQEGNKWPNVRIAQPTAGFASVSLPKETLTVFYPDDDRICYVASRNAGQKQITLTRGTCP